MRDNRFRYNCDICCVFRTARRYVQCYYSTIGKFLTCITFIAQIILTGCANKKGTIEIKGNVVDEYTKVPIPGRDIIVEGLEEKDEKLIPIDSGHFSTDSSGCFTYSLRKVKDVNYFNFFFVGDSDYAFTTEQRSSFNLNSNAKHLSFSLRRLVDFTIKISRKSKTPVCDTLYLSWDSDGIDGRILYPYYKIDNFGKKAGSGLTSDLELRWIGGNVKTTIKARVFEDKRTIVWWVLDRNGKRKRFKDEIICKRDLTNIVCLTY